MYCLPSVDAIHSLRMPSSFVQRSLAAFDAPSMTMLVTRALGTPISNATGNTALPDEFVAAGETPSIVV